MTADLLVILARYPTLGKVKTRLAAEIGKAAALRVYRQLLEQHLCEFRRTEFAVEWRYTPARAPFHRFTSQPVPQPPGDLGQRMQQMFAESFARGYRRVVLIGTDAPEMSRGVVRSAFRLLRTHPAVFQPTEDGGYALIGLTGMVDVFSGIAWSTEQVMKQTRQRLRRARMDFAELPVTFDVDMAADLDRRTVAGGRVDVRQ